MITKNEWSEWDSLYEWEQFTKAMNDLNKPVKKRSRLRTIAIRNLAIGFTVGALVALWLK